MLFPIVAIIVLFPLTRALRDTADGLVDDGVHAADETTGFGAGDEAAAGEERDEGAAAGGMVGVGVAGGEIAFGAVGEWGVWMLGLLFEGG